MLLKKLSNKDDPTAFGNTLRRKRFKLFQQQLSEIKKPIKILDVGGEINFWQMMGFNAAGDVQITLINLYQESSDNACFTFLAGDARSMPQFKDKEFDIVFSNSVIEHVGDYESQKRMANEVMRIGKKYFVQTPSKYFPIEPHFLFPYFQLLPLKLRMFLVMNFKLGWVEKVNTKAEAKELVESVQLLSEKSFTALFPGAKLFREKFLGITKSFILYN